MFDVMFDVLWVTLLFRMCVSVKTWVLGIKEVECVCICNEGVASEGHCKPFVSQLLASFTTASMMMKEWWTLMMSQRPHNSGPRHENPFAMGKSLAD